MIDKQSSIFSTWRVSSEKPTEFGFSYRWWIPKLIYTAVMHDLKFIRRNNKLVYKRAGYKPITPPQGAGKVSKTK